MFTTLFILILSIFGIAMLPILLLIDIISLPVIAIGSWVWWVKHKKNKKNKKKYQRKWKANDFLEFTKQIKKGIILWTKKKNEENNFYYYTRYFDWEMELWEKENYHLMFIRVNGEVAIRAIYYPHTNTFADIYRNDKILQKMREESDFDQVETAIAEIFKQVSDQSWKENVLDIYDEEKMMSEINHWMNQQKNVKILNKYKDFQHLYIENIRYELHMTEEEKQEWKQTLLILNAMIKRNKDIEKVEVIEQTIDELIKMTKRFIIQMEKKYPKRKNYKDGEVEKLNMNVEE